MELAAVRRCFSILSLVALLLSGFPVVPGSVPEKARAQTLPEWPEGEEVLAKRTQNGKVFLQPDGSYTGRFFTEAIHFQDADGVWRDIVTTLVPSQATGFAWENQAGPFKVRFAPTARSSNMVSITQGGDTLSFGAEDANEQAAATVLDGAITYHDVYDGIDLRYEVHNDGVKELIVLTEPPSVSEPQLNIRFPLSLDGFGATETSAGAINVSDLATGNLVFELPKLFMYDASVDPASGDAAFSEATLADLVGSGADLALEVRADASWLNDASRVFPIYIDPSFWNQNPSLDTYVQSNINNTPQNTMDELKSGTYDGSVRAKSLLKFDLASIPNNSTINSATLSPYNFHSWDCNSHATEVYRITESWGSGVVWPGPGFAASPADTNWNSYGNVCPANRLQFNVQSIIQYWKNSAATNEGFGIKAQNMDNVTSWKKFRSNESSFPPNLDVNWTEQDNNPPGAPTISSSSHPSPSNWYASCSPSFSWTTPSDTSGIAGYSYVLDQSSGTFPDNTLDTSSNSRSYGAQPEGTYWFHVRAKDNANNWSGVADHFKVNMDCSSPTSPFVSSSTHTSQTTWSPNNDPCFSWSSSDSLSGVAGYSYELTTNASSTPDTILEPAGTSKCYTDVGDGTWHFRIRARNGAGTWSSIGNYTVKIDFNPAVPSISSSTHPDPNTWYANRDPSFTWSASDESGISGYSYILDASNSTAPDTVSEGTGTARSYSALTDGEWWFHVRAQNGASTWGSAAHRRVRIDGSAPGTPSVSSSTHPTAACSTNNDPSFSWSAGDLSGIDAYSYTLDQNALTVPDNVSEGTATSKSYVDVANGQWWFHVKARNSAGLWSQTSHLMVDIDGVAPSEPAISSSSHPTQTAWVENNDPQFTWAVSDASGINGHSFVLDQSSGTVPDAISDGSTASKGYSDVADGEWYFHVRSRDLCGNWGSTSHYRVRIEMAALLAPSVSSTTHADPNKAYTANDVSLAWTEPTIASGIVGYSYTLDQQSGTTVDTTSEATTRSASYPDLEDGTYYFHVRATSGSGRWGATAHFQIQIQALATAEAHSQLPSDLEEVIAEPELPAELPIVPPPPGGLPDLFPEGGLLGDDSFFGGDLLPDANIAESVTDAFAVIAPPLPPVPNAGSIVTETGRYAMGTLSEIPAGPLSFQLIDGPADYTVTTLRYRADGTPDGAARTDVFPICVPTRYNSRDGNSPPIPGLPIADPDLEINFCPSVIGVVPGGPQRVTYDLDALQPGVRVKVTVSYEALGKRLRLDTIAQTVAHPGDFQMILTAESADPTSTNEVDITSSGRLNEARVRLDSSVADDVVPEGKIRIENVPAQATSADRHRLILTSVEASEVQRTETARIRLQNAADNPNESIILERYDAVGRLVGRVRFSDVPTEFDTTMSLRRESQGSLAQAAPAQLRVFGNQPEAAGETLLAEQWLGQRLLGRLRINAFASDYVYDVELVQNASGRDDGVRFNGSFPNGRPDEGELRLSRFNRNSQTGSDELDATLLVDSFARSTAAELTIIRDDDGRERGARFSASVPTEASGKGHIRVARYRLNDNTNDDHRTSAIEFLKFAPTTTFEARVNGPLNDPNGIHLDLTNSQDVPAQVIEIMRTPTTGPSSRLVLAGSNASEAEIPPHVQGLNLRWDAVPTSFNFDLTVDEQANGVPRTLILTNGSTNAPAAGRIKLTDERANETLGLIVKAPTIQQAVRIDYEGDLAKPRLARIFRDNNAPQPEHALQLFREKPAGLESQIRVLGPNATMSGLMGAQPTKLDGVISNAPNLIDYGVELRRNADGLPKDAVISGSLGSASNVDVDLRDHTLGFHLHQRTLPQTFTYEVQARDFTTSGRPREAWVLGNQSADNPGGRFELSYRGMRMILDSLMQTFQVGVLVQGSFDNPSGARIALNQSSANPDQVIQLIRSGPSGPRIAFTARNAPSAPASENGDHVDVLWTNLPKDFDLELGRREGGRRAWLFGQLSADKPGSSIRLRQHRSSSRQEIHLDGLAAKWLAHVYVADGPITDPRDVTVEVRSNTRAATDTIRLFNYKSGNLTHRLVLRGDDGGSLLPDSLDLEALYRNMPEAFILRHKRTRDTSHEVSQAFSFANYRIVSGFDSPELHANLSGRIMAEFRVGGQRGEFVDMRDLPAEAGMTYTKPRNGDADCIGDIVYGATSSALDLIFDGFLDQGCASGPISVNVTNMPSAGLAVANMDTDGDGRFEFANGQKADKIDIRLPVPDALKSFVNTPEPVDEEFCKSFFGFNFCLDVLVTANPQFKDLRLHLQARDLSRATVATNVGPDGNAEPYPGSSTRFEDRRLWQILPIFAIRNEGAGTITADLSGTDSSEAGNQIRQVVDCCLPGTALDTSHWSDTIELDGKALRARFYGWIVRQGSCAGPSQSGPSPVKCNGNDQELRDDKGQNVHCGIPGHDPVPFNPHFMGFSRTRSALVSRPNTTMYFVPNLYDSFMTYSEAHPRAGEKWYAWDPTRTCQTDWFFASLLREYEPDLMFATLNS